MAKLIYWRQPAHQEPLLDQIRQDETDTINSIHGWCPECRGSGMVMEYGPTDCPNLDQHRLIESLNRPADLMTKTQVAELVGIDIRSIGRHMQAGRLPYQRIGGRAVFERRHVLQFKLSYWY